MLLDASHEVATNSHHSKGIVIGLECFVVPAAVLSLEGRGSEITSSLIHGSKARSERKHWLSAALLRNKRLVRHGMRYKRLILAPSGTRCALKLGIKLSHTVPIVFYTAVAVSKSNIRSFKIMASKSWRNNYT